MRLLYSNSKCLLRKRAVLHVWKLPNHKRIYFYLVLLNTCKFLPQHTKMQYIIVTWHSNKNEQ